MRANLLLFLAVSSVLWACTKAAPDPDASSDPRVRLQIPATAKTVVIFDQTAHLDVDWQQTFADYYQNFVGDIFVEARQILDAQPRAAYSIAEMAYLERHLQAHPEETAPLAAQARRGALRIVGGGMTSPDTLLPETELLLRDYLNGSLFSETTLSARAHAAWLPDSFGHAATVPDLLSAAGFTSVAFARVDGAPTLYENLLAKGNAPNRPGSHAEMLEKLGSADFIWRGPGGGQVLAHYQASGLYCTGDNIDYNEQLEVPGGHIGAYEGDAPAYTDGKIDSYVEALRPYARTPFIFVPVGCDFQHPKQELLDYLDGYNQRHLASTGTYVVAGTFEDYAELVLPYGDKLPQFAADLTPYFMGFYASRAAIKQGVRAAARPFFTAEPFAAALGDAGAAAMQAAAPELRLLTRADHHDFITGTSTDDVVANEQLPLLAQAQAAGQAEIGTVAAALSPGAAATPGAVARLIAMNATAAHRNEVAETQVAFAPPLPVTSLYAMAAGQPVPVEVSSTTLENGKVSAASLRVGIAGLPPLSWRSIDLVPGAGPATPPVSLDLLDKEGQPATGTVVVRVVLGNEHVRAQWDRGQQGGFALTSLEFDGTEALSGPSFVIGDYKDMGGLWRLGNEMAGCTLTPLPPPGDGASEVPTVLAKTSMGARVAFATGVAGSAVREAGLDSGSAGLFLALTTGAAEETTRTASFSFAVPTGAPLRTQLAGGFAERTPDGIYTPTFWPAVGWLSSGEWAVLLRQSTGVRFGTSGQVELMAVRDAMAEQCDIEGGKGTDTGTHRIEWRIEHAAGVLDAEQAAQAFNRPVALVQVPLPVPRKTTGPVQLSAETPVLTIEGDGMLSALKPAERGPGMIVRVQLLPGPVTLHLPPSLSGRKATRTDSSEHDLSDLGIAGPSLTLSQAQFGAIATIRLSP